MHVYSLGTQSQVFLIVKHSYCWTWSNSSALFSTRMNTVCYSTSDWRLCKRSLVNWVLLHGTDDHIAVMCLLVSMATWSAAAAVSELTTSNKRKQPLTKPWSIWDLTDFDWLSERRLTAMTNAPRLLTGVWWRHIGRLKHDDDDAAA